jgi:2-phospho-L-lactate guanylyltransferase
VNPHVIVPFDAVDPKRRLSPILDGDERAAFARAMLDDVVGTLREAGHEPTVLATGPVDVDATVVVDDRPLTPAVNARLAGEAECPAPSPETPVAVVMADLALATPAALERLFGAGGDEATAPDVTIAPGRGGGTNALVVRDPAFRVDYHGASVRDHRRIARDAGLATGSVDSFRLATDVDEPVDLVEVLLHAEGTRAAGWLRAAGVEVAVGEGRVGVERA